MPCASDTAELNLNFPHSNCVSGASFTVEHSLHCPTGRFPAIFQNELGDTTVRLLKEVCSDVKIEPPLQTLSEEFLPNATAV